MGLLDNVYTICNERGITIEDLSVQCGFHPKAIYHWKTSMPAADKLKDVAQCLHISMDELMDFQPDSYSYIPEPKKAKSSAEDESNSGNIFCQ